MLQRLHQHKPAFRDTLTQSMLVGLHTCGATLAHDWYMAKLFTLLTSGLLHSHYLGFLFSLIVYTLRATLHCLHSRATLTLPTTSGLHTHHRPCCHAATHMQSYTHNVKFPELNHKLLILAKLHWDCSGYQAHAHAFKVCTIHTFRATLHCLHY